MRARISGYRYSAAIRDTRLIVTEFAVLDIAEKLFEGLLAL